MTFVKFCGLTRREDIELASQLGVDALGIVTWPRSPRYVAAPAIASLVNVMPPHVLPVGVCVNPTMDEMRASFDAGIRMLQLHGAVEHVLEQVTAAETCWIARSLPQQPAAVPAAFTIVLDVDDPVRVGGTGRTVDWTLAAELAATRRIVLAGGLTPANVGSAIRQVRPWGVDVSSGIERQPGIKDAEAMQKFIAAVREAES